MFETTNHRRGRVVAAAAAIATSSLLLAGCSGGGSASSGASAGSSGSLSSKTVGVSFGEMQNPFMQAVEAGLKKGAQKYGYKISFADAQNSSAQQVNQVQGVVSKGVDAMVYIPIDTAAANTGVQQANAAHIPVVAIDSRPEGTSGAKLASYIATNSVDSAETMCTWIAKKMGGSGELGIIRGILGSTPELQRSEGCAKALKNYPKIKVVSNQSGEWDASKSFALAQNMMSANPNLKAIFAQSDGEAEGAARATKTASTHIIVASHDGFPTVWPYLRDGTVDATQAQQPYNMGLIASDTIANILRGKSVKALQYQPTFTVTKANADEFESKLLYGPGEKPLYGDK